MSLRGMSRQPFGFNMSLSVGDDPTEVMKHRAKLARALGFEPGDMVTQRQVHGNRAVSVENGYEAGESDALVTDREGCLLAVSVADCVPILMFDARRRVAAAVHSGW